MSDSKLARRGRLVAVAALVLAVTGCGASHADVTGKVTYVGRPVVYGTVSVIGSDQKTYYATIKPDGSFTAVRVPVGPAKIGIYSPDPYFEPPIPPAMKAKAEEARRAAGIETPPKPPKGQWVRLPPKYADPLTSGLSVEVGATPTMVTLELK